LQQGREALAGKLQHWIDTFETHGNEISEPLIAGNFFSLAMHVEVTNGKIVAEQFFSDQPPGAPA
jgi:hypothetical protein